MNQLKKLVLALKKRLFGKAQSKPDAKPSLPSAPAKTKPQISDSTLPVYERKNPYFIQIGFDFGTSYCKCVCRDMITNKAWVHIHPKAREEELPFLIPSALVIENNKIFHVQNSSVHYPENGLYHLKTALVLAANEHLDNPFLVPYKNAVRLKKPDQLPILIAACAVYFLAGAIGEIKDEVRSRFPGFGLLPEDYMAINLAIPVEDAQQPKVNKFYKRILFESWKLADQLSGHPSIHLVELQSLMKKSWAKQNPSVDETCFIYPEVSANIQGFVRSRISSSGIYLFSDTGGGTVDQSVFIFMRQDYQEHLTYLAGRVLPLGSSQIERRAAEKCGKIDCMSLENWKKKKERGEDTPELKEAKNWVFKKLNRETIRTLALSKQKLFVKEQLNDIRVIFGGGGHCEHPYQNSVMLSFSGQLFRKALDPDVIGLPIPQDLELSGHETHWMRRLNVAYGLSFEKSELAPFTYPDDVSDPKPEEIWQPRRIPLHAPTKDEC